MKKSLATLAGVLLVSFMAAASAQDAKPYKEGPVTQLSYIKIKPGRFDDYMKWLATSDRKSVV